MNENDLYRSFQQIDDDILERSEGITKKNRKNTWKIIVIAAVCLGLLMVTGILAIYVDEYLDGKEKPVYVEENSTYGVICELKTRYNKIAKIANKERAIPLYEECTIVEFDDKKYYTQSAVLGAKIDESLLGETLGTGKAKSDYFTDMEEIFSVRKIRNVSSKIMIAVEIEDYYYVFRNKLYGVKTLEELFEFCGLPEVLELKRFARNEEYYLLNSDDMIWEILLACLDAKFVWGTRENDSETICFEATSESLGIYKSEITISADGYVSTNIFIHEGAFFIGVEAAEKIISYVKENSQKTGFEPYTYELTGTLLEVGENYVLLQDSIMCKKSEDGKIFRIETDDVRFLQYFESGYIKDGDAFTVTFSGGLDAETGKIELGPVFEVRAAEISYDSEEDSEGFFGFMKEKLKTYVRRQLLKNDPKYWRYQLEQKFAGWSNNSRKL